MHHYLFSGKKEASPMNADKPFPLATFKNSLRLWQARWKAQKAAGCPEPDMAKQVKNRPARSQHASRAR
jgi:hypothetical protein